MWLTVLGFSRFVSRLRHSTCIDATLVSNVASHLFSSSHSVAKESKLYNIRPSEFLVGSAFGSLFVLCMLLRLDHWLLLLNSRHFFRCSDGSAAIRQISLSLINVIAAARRNRNLQSMVPPLFCFRIHNTVGIFRARIRRGFSGIFRLSGEYFREVGRARISPHGNVRSTNKIFSWHRLQTPFLLLQAPVDARDHSVAICKGLECLSRVMTQTL
jgi:hypothetical protein